MDPPILTTWYWGPPLLPRHIQAHTSMCRSGHQTRSLEKQNSCVFFGASRCRFSMSKFCCGCWFEWPNGLVASNILQCGTAACIYNVRLSSIFSWIVYIKFKLYIVYIHIYIVLVCSCYEYIWLSRRLQSAWPTDQSRFVQHDAAVTVSIIAVVHYRWDRLACFHRHVQKRLVWASETKDRYLVQISRKTHDLKNHPEASLT